MTLTFKRTAVEHLLQHAETAAEHAPTLEQLYDVTLHKQQLKPGAEPTLEDIDLKKVPAGLMLVGDHGVYLMSNASKTPGSNEPNQYEYALETNPETNADWWHAKEDTFGSDDGAHFLPASLIRNWLKRNPRSILTMRFTPDTINFE